MPLISLQHITKEYHLGSLTVPVLSDVNLDIAAGEFISIMGPSGSGKTTLMNLIGCLDQPTTGKYLLRGHQVDLLDDLQLSHTRNQEIGFVFQSFHLLSDSTALQNICLPLTYRGIPKKQRLAMAHKSAQRVGIAHRCDHKPTEMSGGQIQRVAVARALIGQPALILADEPTGNLDSKTGSEIMSLFDTLHRQGHTIIMVTHDEKLACCADRVIRLKDGTIVSDEAVGHPPATTPSPTTPDPAADHADHAHHADQVALSEMKPSKLHWADLLVMAIREGLFAHPLRTLLTMLGVLFGVAAVIAMMAINEGARQQAIEQIQQMGLHNVRIRSLKMSKDELREARKNMSLGLSLDDWEAVRLLPTVKAAVPLKEVPADIAYENLRPKGRVIATLPPYETVANFPAATGRFLHDDDVQYARRVCVVGKSIREEIFGPEAVVGKKIVLGSEIFTIIGVMSGKNVPEGVVKAVSAHDLNHDIYVPLAAAKKRFRQDQLSNELDEISVMVQDAHHVAATAQLITQLLLERHRQVRDFEVVVPEELLRQSRKTQEIFDIIMVCIASISLLVGGIGIMNIMLATVTERIREIGIRRAIGASRHDVLAQFLVEAISISIMGGLWGIMAGWGLSLTIAVYTGWQTIVSSVSILLGFGVSTTVGIVFGIYPAWKAALLDPIRALQTT